MEWKIPNRFSAGCAEYEVFDKQVSVLEGSQVRGQITYGDQYVEIAKSYYNTVLSDNQRKKTFLHEAVHAILHTLRKDELNDDDEFVDSFANILCQVLNTME